MALADHFELHFSGEQGGVDVLTHVLVVVHLFHQV